MAESSEEIPAAKRRRTFSAGEKPSFLKYEQHDKPAAEPLTESSDVKSDSTAKTDALSESTKPAGKRVADGEQVPSRKDRKRKRSSIRSSSEHDSELPATKAKAAKTSDVSAAKSEIICPGAATVDQVAHLNQDSMHPSQCSAKDVKQSVKKQKRADKSKKEKKCKHKQKQEAPRLRVISKLVVWLCVVCLSVVYWIYLVLFALY